MPILIHEERGVRYLQFNPHWIQGAMRLSRPHYLELDYTRAMMTALLMRGKPKSVLQIGLGAASITKFLHRYLPKSRLEVVEIDPEVLLNAWQFFGMPPESARLKVEIADGYRYLEKSRKKFDLILVDGFDAQGRAGRLHSLPFYRLCRARLEHDGMMVTNLLSRTRAKPDADPVRKAFDDRVLVLPPCDANTVVLAAVGRRIPMPIDALRVAAQKFRIRTGVNLAPFVSGIQKNTGAL